MPPILGWAANVTTVSFAILVLIFYDFPTILPVKGSNMSKYNRLLSSYLSLTCLDYACAVIGVMALFIAINWFGHAAKRFRGPRLHVLEH